MIKKSFCHFSFFKKAINLIGVRVRDFLNRGWGDLKRGFLNLDGKALDNLYLTAHCAKDLDLYIY